MPDTPLNKDALLDAMDALMTETNADPRAGEWARNVAARVVTAYLSAVPADNVTSVEELNALPLGTIITDSEHLYADSPRVSPDVLRASEVDFEGTMWDRINDIDSYPSDQIVLPATVLYRPVEG